MALVKYNNNSISAVTSAASIPSGAMTLIKTLTASSSGTLTFHNGSSDVVLDSTYPIYVFKFINMHPATDAAEFQFQANAVGDSSFNETMTTTLIQVAHSEDDTSEAGLNYGSSNDQAQGTSFQDIYLNSGNGNDECISGELWLYGISSTTFVKHYMSNIQGYHNANSSFQYLSAGYFNTTAALDEFQFKYSSGNMDSGTIKLYGIKDS